MDTADLDRYSVWMPYLRCDDDEEVIATSSDNCPRKAEVTARPTSLSLRSKLSTVSSIVCSTDIVLRVARGIMDINGAE